MSFGIQFEKSLPVPPLSVVVGKRFSVWSGELALLSKGEADTQQVVDFQKQRKVQTVDIAFLNGGIIEQ